MNRRAAATRLLVLLLGLVVGSMLDRGQPAFADDDAEAVANSDPQPTYAIEYTVRISANRPRTAHVRWSLAGAEEVTRLRLEIDPERHRDFRGSGDVKVSDDEVLWYPRGPYGHLEYDVSLRHRRSRGKGYDSYAGRDWVITRSRDLFPPTHIDIDLAIEPNPRSRSTIRFRLPRNWKSATAMERISTHVYRPEASGRWLDRPRGWIGLGRLDRVERRVAGVDIAIVSPPGTNSPRGEILDLYEACLPSLVRLLSTVPPRLLIVVGPDPMWRGGISGEQSIYLHEDRPIRTPDRTSPPLHEAFHVLAPFRPGTDGLWITEGLAEFYSLELQRRAKQLSEADFRRGLRSFERWGRWRVNLSDDRSLAVTNNSAPLVIAAIDEWIQIRTKGERGLDDVVHEIGRNPEKELTTASFLRIVKGVAGTDLTPFVQRHVYAGTPPTIRRLEKSDDAPSSP